MKHFRTYNESNDVQSIVRDILDISLDVQDNGFRVKVFADKLIPSGFSNFHVTVDKFNGYRRSFEIHEIEDFLLRVIEYDKINPCDIKIFIPAAAFRNKKIEIKYNNGIFTPLNGDRSLLHRITYVDINVMPFHDKNIGRS